MAIPAIYRTATMLTAIRQMVPFRTFLRDRYFPTNPRTDMFPTEEVLVEIMSGSKKLAPCVLPYKKGIVMERSGYKTYRYTPPYVAPERPLTLDDLNRKGFGESVYSDRTPAQRQAEILAQDLMDFDNAISGREEYMAAQAMQHNQYVLRHYADKYGSDEYEEWMIRFYDGTNNPSQYIPSVSWATATLAQKLADLRIMIQMLTSKGQKAADLIVPPDVAEVIVLDPDFITLMDAKNINMGSINPSELPAGVGVLGTINVYGRVLTVFTYDETYTDEVTGVDTPFIETGTITISAPAAGRGLYGAVTQLEEDRDDFVTYMERRVPKFTKEVKTDVRALKETSRPLLVPKTSMPWVSAKVIF